MSIRRIQRGRNHAYTINGEKAVGVTTALAKGYPKPALVQWAAKCTAQEAARLLDMGPVAYADWAIDNQLTTAEEIIAYLKKAPNRMRDEAAVRGTKIHSIAEKLTAGIAIDVPDDLAPYVRSVIRFLDEWKVQPLLTEHTVGSYRWGYAGTFDLIAELPDGRRVLWDYKTGRSGIWPETALQLAAYRYADAYVAPDGTEIPMADVGVTEAKAVWVRPDGYDVIPLTTDGHVFKAFLHTLQVAKASEVAAAWVGVAEAAPWLTKTS